MIPDPSCTAAAHGATRRAYRNGCSCPPALAANTAYKRAIIADHAAGNPRTVEATGARRRIQALMASGWSGNAIGARLYVGRGQIHGWTKAKRISVKWANRISDLYDEIGLDDGGNYRTRARAKANGWPPPIEWGPDIDNPAAKPLDLERIYLTGDPRAAIPVEDLEMLASTGETWDVAAARIGGNRAALERRLYRMRRQDLIDRFYVNSESYGAPLTSRRWSA